MKIINIEQNLNHLFKLKTGKELPHNCHYILGSDGTHYFTKPTNRGKYSTAFNEAVSMSFIKYFKLPSIKNNIIIGKNNEPYWGIAWLEGSKTYRDAIMKQEKKINKLLLNKYLFKLSVCDIILNNPDCHGSNILYKKNKLYLIDCEKAKLDSLQKRFSKSKIEDILHCNKTSRLILDYNRRSSFGQPFEIYTMANWDFFKQDQLSLVHDAFQNATNNFPSLIEDIQLASDTFRPIGIKKLDVIKHFKIALGQEKKIIRAIKRYQASLEKVPVNLFFTKNENQTDVQTLIK